MLCEKKYEETRNSSLPLNYDRRHCRHGIRRNKMTVSSWKTLSLLAMVCVLALVNAQTAAAVTYDPLWVKTTKYDALQGQFKDLKEKIDALSTEIERAYGSQDRLNALIVYEEAGNNHWRLCDAFANDLKSLTSSMKSNMSETLTIDGMRRTPTFSDDVKSMFSKLEAITGKLQGDWNNPEPEKYLGRALIALNNATSAVKPMIPAIHAKLRVHSAGAYVSLSKEEQIDLYTAMLLTQKYLKGPLTEANTADCRSAQTSGDNFKSIDHCTDGNNHWRIRDPHRSTLLSYCATAKRYTNIDKQAGYPEGTGYWEELEGLCKFVLSDWAGPDKGAQAALTLRQKLGGTISGVESQMATFRGRVPNSAEIVAEAEKRAANNGEPVTDNDDSDGDDDDADGDDDDEPADTSNGLLDTGEPDEVTNDNGGTGDDDDADGDDDDAATGNFAEATTHTIKDGDMLSSLAVELRKKFLEAGWKPEDIPNLYAENGLVNALARANNMQPGDILYSGNELKIPAVPRANGGANAYDNWFSGIGGEATDDTVVDDGGSKPNDTQVNAMSTEALKAGLTGFLNKYFPKTKTNNTNTMHAHLKGRPEGVNTGSLKNNKEIAVWMCDIVVKKIDENTAARGGTIDPALKAMYEQSKHLKGELAKYDPAKYDPVNLQDQQQMRSICISMKMLHESIDRTGGPFDLATA